PVRRRRRGSCRISSGRVCLDSRFSSSLVQGTGLDGGRNRQPVPAALSGDPGLLLLNLQVVDDALDALGLPRKLLGPGLLLGCIAPAVQLHTAAVRVNV